jgi:hypothetical protein
MPLIAAGTVDLFCFVIFLYVFALYLTYQKPTRRDVGFATRYRFFFGRFSPDKYYWGIVFLSRSLGLAFIPVLLSSQGPRLLVLLIFLCGYTVFQLLVWPWRGKLTNFADLIVSVSLIATGIIGCLLTPPSDDVRNVAQAVLVGSFVALICVLIACLGRAAIRGLATSRRKDFRYFLSHHKTAAGCMARYMQQLLDGDGKIFLDSDHLQDLDLLIDIVRKDVDVLLVILSEDIFWRPWCAAEITTAVLNEIPIQLVAVEGYGKGPDLLEGDLYERLRTSIPSSDLDALGSFEIGYREIEKAYRHVATLPIHFWPFSMQAPGTEDGARLKKVHTSTSVFSWRTEDANRLKKVLAQQYESPESPVFESQGRLTISQKGGNSPASRMLTKNDYVVVGDAEHREAVAIAKTVASIISEVTHEPTCTVSFPTMDKTDVPHLFILLSPGILSSPEGLATIVLAMRYRVTFCPIQSDSLGFTFPNAKYYERISTGHIPSTTWTTILTLLDLEPSFSPADLAFHIQSFFRVIAVQYSAQAPLKLITSQVEIAITRVQKDREKWKYEEVPVTRTSSKDGKRQPFAASDPFSTQGRWSLSRWSERDLPTESTASVGTDVKNMLDVEIARRRTAEDELERLKGEVQRLRTGTGQLGLGLTDVILEPVSPAATKVATVADPVASPVVVDSQALVSRGSKLLVAPHVDGALTPSGAVCVGLPMCYERP